MTRWTMAADLERCVGCQTCTAACRHANATSPAVQWRKVLDIEAGSFPNVSRTFVPVGCQHCADPPCMHVCPTTATRQRPDGIVTIDYNICIGCAYCEVACPYQARFLVHEPRFAYRTALQNEIEREDKARLGVAQKCTFCSDRIDFGIENGIAPGADPRATPACVNSCIADALVFGDLDDPSSNVSRLLREQRHFRMHEELGTEPGFFYLYGKANDTESSALASAAAPVGRVRTRGIEPWHQAHWDWKAAGNFLCGGAGSSLFILAALAGFAGAPIVIPALVALAFVALGLNLLIFKIGRPFRAIYVLRQPQRSWMSREAWVAGAFFPLALIALWFDSRTALAAAALAALVFLFCQAMMFKEARGIPAWRAASIVPLMIATGLVEGASLFLTVAVLVPSLVGIVYTLAAALVLLVGARALAWRNYISQLKSEGAPTRTLVVLDGQRPWFLMLGAIVPAVLTVVAVIAASVASVLFVAASISAFVAGWTLKFVIVRRAAYNQGFALTHTPVRGTGDAGPAVKPGWSMP